MARTRDTGRTHASGARRVFLGRSRSPLELAEDWLASEHGPAMAGQLVALPGRRAARTLLQRLARRLGPAWSPPRITTLGGATDELLRIEGRPAGRTVRTLAWERALRDLPRSALEPLVARPPDEGDAAAWGRLAEEARRLFGELAAEGLDFARVAAGEGGALLDGERARWEALAQAEARMVSLLREAGLVDPHLARLAAIREGRLARDADLVLVGVAETNELQRRVLTELAPRVTSLVLAPASEADAFDGLGRLLPEAWAGREVAPPVERWRVARGPEDQAREALDAVASWRGRFAAEDVSLGVCDPEVTPYLVRRLEDHGVAARDAAGTPVPRTAPARLLDAAAGFLSGRGFASLAALVRHPDLETALRARADLAGIDAAALLDEHLAWHLPGRVDGAWPPATKARRELDALLGGVLDLLGQLGEPERRPLADWAPAVRGLLERTYGGQRFDEDDPDQRETAGALRAIGEALSDLEGLPGSLAPVLTAGQTLGRLLQALRSAAVPPPPPAPGEPTIELLGWLELPLDDAPGLVVTGFQEGFVPRPVHGDAFLPDALRRELGLEDDDRRLARDAYATALLLASRSEVVFVCGRRSREGDPLLPSRLAFHAPEEEIPARVAHALDPRTAPRRESPLAAAGGRALPHDADFQPPDRYPVTCFRTFLASPYLFYLQHVLGLETVEHDGRELDPAGFGLLAHEALAVLAGGDLCACSDARRIEEALDAELRRLAQERFGPRPLPAVELQLDQLARRLRLFARRQALRAEQGWRVAHAEWTPSRPFELKVDAEPVVLSGRIDRIDVHEDGRWALVDYKTGEARRDPRREHRRRDGTWKDLQLPLYAAVAGELGFEDVPHLGYASLGRDEPRIGFDLQPWDGDELSDALECAREVVRRVRRGPPFELGEARPLDPVFRALCGRDLLEGDADDESEAES